MLKFCTNARRAWAGMCQASLSQNPRNAAEDYSKHIAAMARAGLACPVAPKTEDLVQKNPCCCNGAGRASLSRHSEDQGSGTKSP